MRKFDIRRKIWGATVSHPEVYSFCLLIQVILELAAAAGMAQLAQGLSFDLANAFAGHMELFAHLFQGTAAAIIQAKAQLQHLALALGQAIEHILHLLFEQLMAGGIRRRQGRVILDEIAEMTIIFLADRRLQAHRFLADLDDLPHFLSSNIHLLSNLFGRWFAPKILQQAAADANQAVDRLHHVHGDTNRASLIRARATTGLADPPGSVRAELVALGIVKLLYRSDQADIALLDQIQQAHATADVLFRHTDDETQIRFRQATLCFLPIIDQTAVGRRLQTLCLPAFHTLCELYLFFCREQRDAANLAQIHAHRIVQAALQISNYNAKAIMQLIPLGIGHDLGIHFILRSRFPIHRWLFCRIQGIHRLFVL